MNDSIMPYMKKAGEIASAFLAHKISQEEYKSELRKLHSGLFERHMRARFFDKDDIRQAYYDNLWEDDEDDY